MNRLIFTMTLIIAFMLFGCEKEEIVQIRIKNNSEFDYVDVHVSSNGDAYGFGNISSNESSQYQLFDYAYRFAYVELKIYGETYTLQPNDYVSEKKLKSGKYSYIIGVNQTDTVVTSITLHLNKE